MIRVHERHRRQIDRQADRWNCDSKDAGNYDYCAVATQGVSKRNPCWRGWRPAGGRGQCVYACHRALESSVLTMAQTDGSDFYNIDVQYNNSFPHSNYNLGPALASLLPVMEIETQTHRALAKTVSILDYFVLSSRSPVKFRFILP